MIRLLVVFCPQVTPPDFSDKRDFKANLIPISTVSVKSRPYILHIPGLKQSWPHALHDTLSQGRVLLHPYLPLYRSQQGDLGIIWRCSTSSTSFPGDRRQLWHSHEWKTQHFLLQARAEALSILSGFCFCFTAVQYGIAMTSLSQTSLLPHWFFVLSWSQRRLPAIAPRWREKERVGGEKEEVFTSVFLVWTDTISWDTCQGFCPQQSDSTMAFPVGLITIIPTLFK